MAEGIARLRGRIAEMGVKHHVVAEEVGMHYTQLSRILNERQPMPKGFEGAGALGAGPAGGGGAGGCGGAGTGVGGDGGGVT